MKIVHYLNEAEHVARIQRYFGLVWKDEAPTPKISARANKSRIIGKV